MMVGKGEGLYIEISKSTANTELFWIRENQAMSTNCVEILGGSADVSECGPWVES